MKKVYFFSLLITGILYGNVGRAQCIEKLILSTTLDEISDVIDNNVSCIKETLNNQKYEKFKFKINYLYKTSYIWVYHKNPEKERLFNKFYQTYGYLYPSLLSIKPTSGIFYDALNEMIASDPKYFSQIQKTNIPLKYIQWMRVKGLKEKFGEASVIRLMQSASKIIDM
ncbi:MAG: hypothetical protein WCI91_01050 [Candidatus Nomurabacteria bacterium]